MKHKYEICQQNSDGTWNVIAWTDVYMYAVEIKDAMEFADGKEYAIYKDGEKIKVGKGKRNGLE